MTQSPSTAELNARTRQEGDTALTPLSGKKVHFSGIGGCGMSGLARLIHRAGGALYGQ